MGKTATDTTDTDKNKSVFCHVIYDELISSLLDVLDPASRMKAFGGKVIAF